MEWIAPTIEIADQAARLRADFHLQTPDAIHASTALVAGATALITNDYTLRRAPGLKVLVLDEML